MLADNWFGSKANMVYIHKDLNKSFIIGIKSNRTLALSENDAKNGRYQQVWLKGLDFPVRLLKKVFKNENGSIGILYLVSNDMHSTAERLYEVYQKRWRIEIEQFHRELKQLIGIDKYQCRKQRIQRNHIACAIHVWGNLKKNRLSNCTNCIPNKKELT